MKLRALGLFLLSPLLSLTSAPAQAQGAAPEMFGVREVVVEYARFDDPKTSDLCSLTREGIASSILKTLSGTTVPALAAIDAKPPMMGVARIQLIPVISTHVDENMDCVSWVSLSAESRANTIISPISTLRSITAVYWRQHVKVATSRSLHTEKVALVVQKMAEKFAQQYRLDQPPELPK